MSVYKLCNISYTYPCMFYFHSLLFFPSSKFQKKIVQKGAKAGGKAPKKSTSGAGKDGQGEEAHGILEGISSLHSWIKTQTMIRPHPKSGARGGKPGAMYDEVKISSDGSWYPKLKV